MHTSPAISSNIILHCEAFETENARKFHGKIYIVYTYGYVEFARCTRKSVYR